MLVFSAQKLAFIAVPKTGTTALEMALRPYADIIFTKNRKHMPAHRFHNRVAPFLEEAFGVRLERMAVLRDPEEQIRSWYRYRTAALQRGSAKSTRAVSFDQFVRDVISEDPPPYAGIGSQWNMVTGKSAVLVHHLFAYETQDVMHGFIEERFGEAIDIKRKNVSPRVDAPLDDATREALREARPQEFALYDRLRASGGHLISQIAPT
ncbi:MAG: hypothetical protein AAGF79_10510 [Pseudomonadota bacterium]